MLDIESVKTADLGSIAAYVPKLFESVTPLLQCVDKSLLSEKSGVTVHLGGRYPFLEVRIESNESDIPGVYLYATRGRCSLGIFGFEYLEDNHPASDIESLIEQVCSYMRRYLEGITIVYYYARNGRLVKWEGYWGIDPAVRTKAVTGGHGFSFLRKVASREEKSFSFVAPPDKGAQRTLTSPR